MLSIKEKIEALKIVYRVLKKDINIETECKKILEQLNMPKREKEILLPDLIKMWRKI